MIWNWSFSSSVLCINRIAILCVGFGLGIFIQSHLTKQCKNVKEPKTLSSGFPDNNRQWPPVYLGRNTILCQVRGRKMFLDTRDVGIVPHLCTNDVWESHIESIFRRTVKSGWRVMDVGANFGYYSIVLADLIGPNGSGLVVEAMPDIYSLLSATLQVNGFRSRMKVLNYAAFDQKTILTFKHTPARKLNAHFLKDTATTDNSSIIQVPALTIDEMVAKQWTDGVVNFIKIDVEGAEARAWKGMQETLRKNKESIVVIMEVNTRRLKSMNEDFKTFYENIQSWFPRIRKITHQSKLELITSKQLEEIIEYEDYMLLLSNNPLYQAY